MGNYECVCKACVGGQEDLCGKATVKITVKGEEPAGEGGDGGISELPKELISSTSLQFVLTRIISKGDNCLTSLRRVRFECIYSD